MKKIIFVLFVLSIIAIAGCGEETDTQNVSVIGSTPVENQSNTAAQYANSSNSTMTIEEPDEATPGDPMYVHFIDVVGDSAFVKAPNGRMIVINGGDPHTSGKLISYLRTQLDYTQRLDATIATGPRGEQVGGIGTIMFNIGVWEAYDSNISDNTNVYSSYEGFASQYPAYRYPVRNHTMIYIDRNVQTEILSPYGKVGLSDELDDNSLLVWIYYLENSFLFTGECSAECQRRIVADRNVDVDVLQAPQGGNNSVLTDEFLDAVSPKIVIASDVDRPVSQEFLNRMAARGIEVHTISEEGPIVIRTDGFNYEINSSKTEE